ncbi:V-type ATP synthase subunit F [Mesoaciditoga lauensis]|uniref:V-type ATP synthase subunit F n=1 Tax=Mesoaciditoga lauensis TaxID=1495039 RepID=UPI00056B56D5|nr:V-type ATP synthase subunit F [Mesoaciditoga lauensis]
MKFFLISDNIDTQIGLRLVGIKGIVVHKREEILDAVKKAKKMKDIGVILMTEKIADKVPEIVYELRTSKSLPLLTIIPDRHGTKRPKDFITRYVKEAIGVKLE